MPTASNTLPIIDAHPDTGSFQDDVLVGLAKAQKTIPSKYLYDKRGSELFDRICELDAYYPTRTEMGIMQTHGAAMAEAVGPDVRLVEYGSGSSLKTRMLLDHLETPVLYVPVDISREHLVASAEELAEAYPDVPVQPVCADYTDGVPLPEPPRTEARTVVYFPGSTIGNFRPDEAELFLRGVADVVGPGGGLLIGVDLRKAPNVLRTAYNDPEGVTADFNLNLLRRINRELEGTFNLDRFRHKAIWNDEDSCIEMHLVSTARQTVSVAGVQFSFADGETIRTEYSFKYTLDDFAALAARAGFSVTSVWTDDRSYFSVQNARVGVG